jgi:hypothetical protein
MMFRQSEFVRTTSFLFAILAAAAMFASPAARAQSKSGAALAASFLNPPPAAKPQVWWHWVNGNISKPGIVADLKEMKKVGIGGGTICNLGDFAPEGPVHFNSQPWWDDMKFAMNEASKLGLELGVEDCQGWSSSGGPWIKPQDAMKMVVWSETRSSGGASSPIVLAQPHTRLGYYHDIAVLAFPTVAADAGPSLADVSAQLTANGQPVDTSFLFTGNSDKTVPLHTGSQSAPGLVVKCPAPFTADELRYSHGMDYDGQNIEIDSSNDGDSWAPVAMASEQTDVFYWNDDIKFTPVTAQYFRVLFKDGNGNPVDCSLASFNLVGPATGANDDVPLISIVDLTSKLAADGTVVWSPPTGNWTIIRFGYTDSGAVNHPANKYGVGLECDKLSKVALQQHFDGFVNRVISTGASVPGKPVKWSLIDSYEIGYQNWTDGFDAEFDARTGYSIRPWLITLTGRTVESREMTTRFQFDFIRTISELWDTNYYGYFADLLHRQGILAQCECYGDGYFDTVRSSGLVDMPMSEYWWPGDGDAHLAKQVASAAHVYGHTLVGAESFTAGSPYFGATPWNMKREGDNIFAAGVNRYYFHSGEHQPGTDGRKPGLTWDFGIFMNRNNTWYDTGKAYFAYLGRCMALLQQGRFVGDILAYEGEEGNGSEAMSVPPKGYASDEIDSDLLVKSVDAHNGILTLPDGESYRMLALANSTTISLPVLKKIEMLVNDGAVVFGPKPEHSLGLVAYPGSDVEVAKIADEMWGNIDGNTVVKHQFGKGWVYWTGNFSNAAPVLADRGIAQDFSYEDRDVDLVYLHKKVGASDYYFVSNQEQDYVNTSATFRVADGLQPEIWDPQKGTISNAPVWSKTGYRGTTVALQLNPGQSVFVVFRTPAAAKHILAITQVTSKSASTHTLTVDRAIYGAPNDPTKSMEITDKLQAAVSGGKIHTSIGNALAGNDPAPFIVKQAVITYTFDGKQSTVTIPENEVFTAGTFRAEAPYSVLVDGNGKTSLLSWIPAKYLIRYASGPVVTKTVADAPRQIALTGPWTVHFSPRWGGPASVVFDSLSSWTKSDNAGIKYYSGTAEYDLSFDVSPSWLKPGRKFVLNLGDVGDLANIELNGYSLGCLWSPPFRADATGIVRAGLNRLVVKVTNTWENRLIGDDALPQSQRITYTTEHFYDASTPLQPAGLIGPVILSAADPVKL